MRYVIRSKFTANDYANMSCQTLKYLAVSKVWTFWEALSQCFMGDKSRKTPFCSISLREIKFEVIFFLLFDFTVGNISLQKRFHLVGQALWESSDRSKSHSSYRNEVHHFISIFFPVWFQSNLVIFVEKLI